MVSLGDCKKGRLLTGGDKFLVSVDKRREGEKEYFVVGVPEVRGKREKGEVEGEEEEEEVEEERGLRRAVVEREGYR